MDSKEKALLKKIFELNTFVLSNLDNDTLREFSFAYNKFESELRKIVKDMRAQKTQPKEIRSRRATPIWEKFSTMTEDEIRREFSDIWKYPDINSIKSAVRGFLELRKVSKVKTRETLIKHIIETYRKGEFISKIGRKAESDSQSGSI